jgi:PadR family transcriptional regulator
MKTEKADVPYGTLDLLVLKTLDAMGPLHGFGIARRIEQVAQDTISLNQGSIYPSLLRLEQKGWIGTEWGSSDNGRKAKFYSITALGKRHLKTEVRKWERATALVAKFLEDMS